MSPFNFLLLFVITTLVFAFVPTATSTSTGFSLRLFYANTTDGNRAGHSSLRSGLNTIRPRMQILYSGPYVRVGFGTPNPQEQILHVDTASDFTWFPCQIYVGTLPPGRIPFDKTQSRTCQHVAFNDPYCRQTWTKDASGFCTYEYPYEDGTRSRGMMYRDTLSSPSSDHGRVVGHVNYVFGCSQHTIPPRGFQHPLSTTGILGMSRGALSLPHQLQQPKFSHCFSTLTGAVTYLRFGTDTDRRGSTLPLKSTPFRSNNLPGDSPMEYYLNAVDISVNNQRLNLRPRELANRQFVIDSGTTRTNLYRDAYEAVKRKLVEHFARFGIQLSSEMCFRDVPGRRFEPPTMDIHFATGEDYHISAENLFQMYPDTKNHCLMIKSSDKDSILGFYQQRNMRIIFDLTARPNGALRFAQEDCSRDPAV